MSAELLMLLGGVGAFTLTLYWVRSRDLGERHALGWLAVAALLLVCGLFPELIESFAAAARLSYPTAVLFVALTVAYFFAFGVSVALTRLHRRTVRLLQHIALLECRIRELEAARSATAVPNPTEKNGVPNGVPAPDHAPHGE